MSEILGFLLFIVLFVIAYYWSQGNTKKRIAQIKKQGTPNVKKKNKYDERYKKALAKPKYRQETKTMDAMVFIPFVMFVIVWYMCKDY